MNTVLVALIATVIALTGCNRESSSPLPMELGDSTLGPGDLFEVRVYNEKELTGEFQVSPDGTIAYPFIGVLTVAGKDTRAIAQEIASKLKDGGFLRDPYVSIRLQESHSKKVSVLGAVAKPGTLDLVPGMTAVQAISQAGGFTPLASKDDTVVSRRVGGKLQRYRIPMTEIARGGADDFALRAGDLIFVPERVF